MAEPHDSLDVRKLRGAYAHGSLRRPRAESPPGTLPVKFATGRELSLAGGHAPGARERKFAKGRKIPLAGGHAPGTRSKCMSACVRKIR